MDNSGDGKSTDRDGSISAASLQKARRRRNLLMLVLLLLFVVAVYFASFSHVGEEAGPLIPARTESGRD